MVVDHDKPIDSEFVGKKGDAGLDKPESLASSGSRTTSSPKSLDLMTLAGLTQWCARAIRNIGRENFETLVQVSLMTGRLSEDTGKILLALVPLFEGTSEEAVSAKEVVALMLQLDGLLSTDNKADARMLPFLFMEEMDPFSSAASKAREPVKSASARRREE